MDDSPCHDARAADVQATHSADARRGGVATAADAAATDAADAAERLGQLKHNLVQTQLCGVGEEVPPTTTAHALDVR